MTHVCSLRKDSSSQQPVVKVWRRIETGEAPRGQGATTENTGQYLSEEQRSPRGCIARRMQPDFHHGLPAQSPDSGRQVFVSRCAGCHGSDGNGGELGPAIAARVPSRTDEDLTSLFRQGLPAAGMPAFPSLTDTETGELIRYLRTLRPRTGSALVRTTIT